MSPAKLESMARTWNRLLEQAGLRIARQEAMWCCSATDTLEATISVSDVEVTRRSREQGFKALGVWITFDGHVTKESSRPWSSGTRSRFILRRLVEQATGWKIPIFVMDCDVAAAFDHVSHHVIVDVMEYVKVLPMLGAAWI